MPKTISGKRYAQAAFELAMEKGDLKEWREGLHKAVGIVDDGEIMDLLENPKLPFESKKSLIRERLGKMDALVINLIYLLMSRGKLRSLSDISRQYDQLLDTHYGVVHAKVVTALPLEDNDKKTLSDQLAKMVDHRVIIDERIDPHIVGGFRARIGDTLIDGSIHSMLEGLRRRLL